MNRQLREILEPAYRPYMGFDAECRGAVIWEPETGHVSRGFYGALGELEEVELVMMLAEPANPTEGDERFGVDLDATYYHTGYCFLEGNSIGHKRARRILKTCFPGMSMIQIIHRTWITESVLCTPANGVLAAVRSACERRCVETYLIPQLRLFPNAVIGAMGYKARYRLKRFAPEFADRIVECNAVFGYRGGWSATWDTLAHEIQRL